MASALFYKGKLYGDEIPVEDNYDPESKLPISGKGVAEALENVEIEVKQDYDPTSEEAISGKGVADALDTLPDWQAALDVKEDLSNKVTTIGSYSTDAQYPTAKAVYSAIPKVATPQYKLVESVTLSEDTQYITRSTEPDGTPYNFKCIAVSLKAPSGTGTINNVQLNINLDKQILKIRMNSGATEYYPAFFSMELCGELVRGMCLRDQGIAGAPSEAIYGGMAFAQGIKSITDIKFGCAYNTDHLPSGTVIDIYGVKE